MAPDYGDAFRHSTQKVKNFDFFHEAGDDEPYIGLMLFVSGLETGSLVPGTVTYIHSGFLRSNSSSRLVMGVRGRSLSFLM